MSSLNSGARALYFFSLDPHILHKGLLRVLELAGYVEVEEAQSLPKSYFQAIVWPKFFSHSQLFVWDSASPIEPNLIFPNRLLQIEF